MLKGIAITMMLILHFIPMLDMCKFCIAIFSLISGYSYYFNPNKTYRYSLSRIGKLCKVFFIVFALYILVAVVFMGKRYTPWTLVKDMLTDETVIYAWYVRFYVVLMLIVPASIKIIKKPMVRLISIIVFSFILYGFAEFFSESINVHLYRFIASLALWTPAFFLGFSMGEYELLEKANRLVSSVFSTLWVRRTVLLLICFLSLFVIYDFDVLDGFGIFTVAIKAIKGLVFGTACFTSMVLLCKETSITVVRKVLAALGRESTYMWLLQSIFFNYEGILIHYVMYLGFIPIRSFPRNLIVITLWCIFLCYLVSLAIRLAVDWSSKKAAKLFRS